VLVRIDIKGVIWAGLHAGLAADARIGIEIDDPGVSLEQGPGRADRHTRGIGAVIAPHDRKHPGRIRPRALFNILDPGPIDTKRNIVFRLASHRAGVTADALVLVDDETVPHATSPTQ
jgi:hypothetical protein